MRRSISLCGNRLSPAMRMPGVCFLLFVWGCTVRTAEEAKPAPSPAPGEPSAQDRGLRELLPPLPKEKLPPRTRPAPDPSKDQYVRDPVFVLVEESVTPSEGPDYVPDVPVVRNYLRAYFERAGHPTVDEPEKAKWHVEGTVKLRFHSTLKALGTVVGWKYRAEASFRVVEASGEEADRFEIPELYRENSRSEASCVLDIRRYLAKAIWDRMFRAGRVFGSRKAEALINSLALESSGTAKSGEDAEPETTDAVVNALADMGLEAVPHLIEALLDERPVLKKATYPGLTEATLSDLRIYHVADKALEEIFQKVSRLSLASEKSMTPREKSRVRRAIIAGWENEWKRFCPSFAASRWRAGREGETAKEPEK